MFGQEVGDEPEGLSCRVVSSDKYDKGVGAERYDVKFFGLPPKSEKG